MKLIHAEGCTTNLGVIGAECNCGSKAQLESCEREHKKVVRRLFKETKQKLENGLRATRAQAEISFEAGKKVQREEHKKDVGEIFKEIENCRYSVEHLSVAKSKWQALKQKWGVK